jgi:3-deoxy-D-manno-octulosonate 8-phosphate phosphatase (KDO 8-P phosphatase)
LSRHTCTGAQGLSLEAIYHRARSIKLAIFDVDGVLTDGSLHLSDSGEESKAFHVLDGHGMNMLRATGVELAMISGRTSRCVARRAESLQVAHLFQGVEDKLAVYVDLLAALGLERTQSCYMGDDVMDLPILVRCGLAVSVPDAPEPVRRHAHYVTHKRGGRGAARECCELIMDAQGTLSAQLQAYLT